MFKSIRLRKMMRSKAFFNFELRRKPQRDKSFNTEIQTRNLHVLLKEVCTWKVVCKNVYFQGKTYHKCF